MRAMEKLFTKERRQARLKYYASPQWKRIRKRELEKHPLCVECLKKTPKRIEKATIIDHIDPNWHGFKGFLSGKFQALCHECHNLKTFFDDLPSLKKREMTEISGIDI